MYYVVYSNELYHHGIKGQKWGVRRFQNDDGSLKSAGKKRYTEDGSGGKKSIRGSIHRLATKNYELNAKTYERLGNKTMASMNRAAAKQSLAKAAAADAKKSNAVAAKQSKAKPKVADVKKPSAPKTKAADAKKPNMTDEERSARNAKIKKAVKIGAAAAATALAAYGTYKLLDKAEVANTGRNLSNKVLSENNGDYESAYKAILDRQGKMTREYATGNLDRSAMTRATRVYGSASKHLAKRSMHINRQNNEQMQELSELAGKRLLKRIYR